MHYWNLLTQVLLNWKKWPKQTKEITLSRQKLSKYIFPDNNFQNSALQSNVFKNYKNCFSQLPIIRLSECLPPRWSPSPPPGPPTPLTPPPQYRFQIWAFFKLNSNYLLQILKLNMVLFKLEMIHANNKLFFTEKKSYK
jgi:hypothetical protein